MNKSELVQAIAARSGLTQKQSDAALITFMDIVIESVASGDKVTLVGFGTFDKRDRAAREGRNPKTGEPITIPAASVPGFNAGKLFRDKVGDGSQQVEAA